MIKILYADRYIAVCVKPVGLNSQADSTGEKSMLDELSAYYNGKQQIFPVHRLDKAVGGVMVYAAEKQAAAVLSRQVQERTMTKEYFAVVYGRPEPEQGSMSDLVFKDSAKNKAYVVKRMRRGVKEAKLNYSTVYSDGVRSVVRVELETGRFHQIRVQFASRKMPLVGDGKYGAKDNCPIALWSCRICFTHPVSGDKMDFFAQPEGKLWSGFEEYLKT